MDSSVINNSSRELGLYGTTERKYAVRMWANAQRDGRPAEYRWRPLLECRAVTLAPQNTTRSAVLGPQCKEIQ